MKIDICEFCGGEAHLFSIGTETNREFCICELCVIVRIKRIEVVIRSKSMAISDAMVIKDKEGRRFEELNAICDALEALLVTKE